jgi:Chlorophyllase enzyme
MRLSTLSLATCVSQVVLAQQGDLPDVAKQFPPGKDSGTEILNITISKGPYQVKVESNPAFQPNRTIYLPLNVPSSVSVPILSWGNGMCIQVGKMYEQFLTEIASHGYFVIAHGDIKQPYPGPSYPASWQTASVDMAEKWAPNAPIKLDFSKIALGGHSCGAGQSALNLANDAAGRYKVGLVMNSQSANAEDMAKSRVPLLFINGGEPDNPKAADQKYNTVVTKNPTLPIFKAVLETGHLGSYWSQRGGVYAETVVHWLDWHLKGDDTSHKWFVGGGKSPAAVRGWKVTSNNVV